MIKVFESHLADITVTAFCCNVFWITGEIKARKINVNLRGADETRKFLKQLEIDFGSFKFFDLSERI